MASPPAAHALIPTDLTFSGGLITDAVRAAGVEGDGLPIGSGVGIWQGTTNLVNNGGFETNTTGWSPGGSNTIERVSAASEDIPKMFGDYVLKSTYQNSSVFVQHNITLTAAPQSLGVWIYIPSSYDGGAPRATFSEFAGASGTTSVEADLGRRDQWQRVQNPNFTPDAGDLSGLIQVSRAGSPPTAGQFIYIDGVQVEAGSIATPYVHTDGSTASRTTGRIQVPNIADYLSESQGWVAALVRTGVSSTALPTPISLFNWRDNDNNRVSIGYRIDTGRWFINRRAAAAGNLAEIVEHFDSGAEKVFIAKSTPTTIGVSVDGGAFTNTGNTHVPSLAATSGDIGQVDTTNPLKGNLGAFVLGSGTLTNDDAAALDAVLRNNPTPDKVLAALSPASSPTLLWQAVNSQATILYSDAGSPPASITVSTSRPSAASPLAANVSATDTQAAILDNGSRYLASDSAKVLRTSNDSVIDAATTVASQSGALTTVYFGEQVGSTAQAGTDVLAVPITAMHTVRLRPSNQIPTNGAIRLTYPTLAPGDADNPASPSATTFQMNGLSSSQVRMFADDTDITSGIASVNITNAASGSPPIVELTLDGSTSISAGTQLTIILGCTAAITPLHCQTQASRIINPTKTGPSGTGDTWKVALQAMDGGGDLLYHSTVSIGTIESVQVLAQVDARLTLSIAGVGNGQPVNTNNTTGCEQTELTNAGMDATAAVVNLGVVAQTPASDGKVANISAQLLTVSTNAAGGYALTATSSGALRDTSTEYELASSTTPAAFPPMAQWFGLHACGLDVDPVTWVEDGSGTACDTHPAGSSANECLYGWPTRTTALTLAADPAGPVGDLVQSGNGLITVSYAAGSDASVPAGQFQTYITYVLTPTF